MTGPNIFKPGGQTHPHCNLCGREAKHKCAICGRDVCDAHYDNIKRMCPTCAGKPRQGTRGQF